MHANMSARVLRLERKRPSLTPGLNRCTDDELHGLIEVCKQVEAGKPIDPERRQWAIAVLAREHEWREGLL